MKSFGDFTSLVSESSLAESSFSLEGFLSFSFFQWKSARATNAAFTLPLVGRVARRSAAKTGGVGVVR
jgi:hypothetical protein